MFETFEKLLDPYPDEPPATPPRGLWSFLWACTAGARGPIAAMAALTATIGVFEAYLFNLLGSVVDWLGRMFICNRLDTTDAGLIGDLTKDTLDNIWNGPKRREMLKAHLAGRRQDANSLCATCNYWGIPAD